jgi:hypothetical protein
LLTDIFEANLKLFSNQSRKKVLFVLRDFPPKGNFEKIKQSILNDISEIYKKIYKPEALIDTVAEDFFDFEFALLPHKIYER